MEPWWTPAVHDQAKSRIWRTGQSRTVKMHWLIVEETIEQRILEVCKEKDAIESDFFGERRGKMKSHLNVTTLGRLIGYGNKRKRQAEAEIGSILRPAPAARPNVLAARQRGTRWTAKQQRVTSSGSGSETLRSYQLQSPLLHFNHCSLSN